MAVIAVVMSAKASATKGVIVVTIRHLATLTEVRHNTAHRYKMTTAAATADSDPGIADLTMKTVATRVDAVNQSQHEITRAASVARVDRSLSPVCRQQQLQPSSINLVESSLSQNSEPKSDASVI